MAVLAPQPEPPWRFWFQPLPLPSRDHHAFPNNPCVGFCLISVRTYKQACWLHWISPTPHGGAWGTSLSSTAWGSVGCPLSGHPRWSSQRSWKLPSSKSVSSISTPLDPRNRGTGNRVFIPTLCWSCALTQTILPNLIVYVEQCYCPCWQKQKLRLRKERWFANNTEKIKVC